MVGEEEDAREDAREGAVLIHDNDARPRDGSVSQELIIIRVSPARRLGHARGHVSDARPRDS